MPSAFERAARSAARSAGRFALDLLLPPQCLTCDRPVDAPGRFCPACFAKTQFSGAPCCTRCGVVFEAAGRGGVGGECPECQVDPPPWEQARAALRYDDQARRIILPFKYGDRIETARALAPLMARAGAELLRRADWLVPVPLHRSRMMARRYNQAAELARAVAKVSGRPTLLDALRRVRATSPLAELSPARRESEVAGAIVVRLSRRVMLQDSRVLLVDDVLTSGSTARACVQALREAGVAGVDVLAAARTHSRTRDG